MAETSKQQSSPPPEELHWGIAYLREDIQDLRQDMRHESGIVHSRIDESTRFLIERIDENTRSLNARIDSRFALLVTIMVALTGVIVAAIKL